ncbi:MAG: CAP domain-containing protein [Thermoleophilia bacterium]|nr:CAP domain-containing protein [Thermoleophilia bacterium]
MKTPIVIIMVTILGTLLLATPALAYTPLNSYEKRLLALVNKQRAKHSLPQLRTHSRLLSAARAHSAEMGEKKYFSHSSASGQSWSSRIISHGYKRTGYRYWKAGENIYYGCGLYSAPAAVIKAWMASKPHRAIILTRAFRNVGIGAVKTTSGYKSYDGTVWFFTLDAGRRIAR